MNETCKTCKFWHSDDQYSGICEKIMDKVEVELVTGWDGGYVKHFETDNDFGCVLWEKKP
ncbi:hypothetical protein P343_12725 [Sporolactobacillus laevolacticus DSM 442]|uniref:Uncharacterized protein n=1 Tax=Sporolactobacillus laevolacticus DSM 442 TaxID=1395513 RepID=V6IVL1_9BACL|nr:hypothetical protein P343_12725 [Sporolactobacillus laevolacticus DSM 442]